MGVALQADGAKKTLALKPENLSNLAGATAQNRVAKMFHRTWTAKKQVFSSSILFELEINLVQDGSQMLQI